MTDDRNIKRAKAEICAHLWDQTVLKKRFLGEFSTEKLQRGYGNLFAIIKKTYSFQFFPWLYLPDANYLSRSLSDMGSTMEWRPTRNHLHCSGLL